MLRTALVLLSMTVLQYVSISQSSTINEYPPQNWELGFAIGPNFTLSSFQGSTFSVSKYISENQKFRLGLTIAVSSKDNELKEERYYSDTLFSNNNSPDEIGNKELRVSFQYVEYLPKTRKITPYYVIGPVLSYSSNNTIDNNNGGNLTTLGFSKKEYDNMNYGIGILGGAGAEWQLNESISIHAEYQLEFAYYWGDSESTYLSYTMTNGVVNTNSKSKEIRNINSSEWRIQSYGVLFGLSLFL